MPVKVLIICSLDEFANGVKPAELSQYLRAKGCEVEVYSASYLSRIGKKGLAGVLPKPRPWHLALYLAEGIAAVAGKLGKLLPGSSPTLTKWSFMKPIMRLRGAVLRANFRHSGYDMIICEHNWDVAFVEGPRLARIQLLDLPSPFAEEVYFGGHISRRNYLALRDYEVQAYAKADGIGFHWHTYSDYVKKEKYDGPNFIDLSYGVDLPVKRASYSPEPRVAFLGWLGDYWVNLPLLVRLCKIYPHIDIYGGPRLAELGENYKGYAPTTDVLADYQLGLVTLREDPLRRHGFSSKQLRYYSYGLPALLPGWHHDSALDEAALLYDEENFLRLVSECSDRQKWTELSDRALGIAQRYEWKNVLRSLDPFLAPAQPGAPAARVLP